MISTAEVARLAHRLGVGDRVIEKDYVLSWLLVAIADSDLRGKLAFKGRDLGDASGTARGHALEAVPSVSTA